MSITASKKVFLKRLLILVVVLIAVVSIGVAGIEITCTPWFCNRCHEMNVYYETWDLCNHGKRGDCMKCHVKPGLINFLKAKVYGVFGLFFHILGFTNVEATLPVVCVREGCHIAEEIDNTVRKRDFVKTVKMDHIKHIEINRRIGTRYDCIPCHKDVAHSRKKDFMPDMKETCFICHSDSDIRYQNCIACHPRHPVIETQAEAFYEMHNEAEVGCGECHIDAHKANALSCLNCHDESDIESITFELKDK